MILVSSGKTKIIFVLHVIQIVLRTAVCSQGRTVIHSTYQKFQIKLAKVSLLNRDLLYHFVFFKHVCPTQLLVQLLSLDFQCHIQLDLLHLLQYESNLFHPNTDSMSSPLSNNPHHLPIPNRQYE